MPMYQVTFEQQVQELATVEIYARSPEAACAIANEMANDDMFDFDWSDGKDIDFRGVVEVSKDDKVVYDPANSPVETIEIWEKP